MAKTKTKTIDFTLAEVSDEKDGKHLFGFSAHTVKDTINKIETKYFNGRRVYHGTSTAKNNPVIFRPEIKGLLLILLKIELEDVFLDDKTKDTGVSVKSISSLIETYNMVFAKSILSPHEKRVLFHCSDNFDDAKSILNKIRDFKISLTRMCFHLATKYHDSLTDYYSMTIKKIDEISETLILGADEYKIINVDNLFNPLDLRTPIVCAIEIILKDIFYFDKDNLCLRRDSISVHKTGIETSKLEKISSEYTENYYMHIECDVNDDTLVEIHEDNFEKIDKQRKDLINILDKYYKLIYPDKNNAADKIEDADSLSQIFKQMNVDLRAHLRCHLMILNLLNGNLNNDEYETINGDCNFLERYNQRRDKLSSHEEYSLSFKEYLLEAEKNIGNHINNDTEISKNMIAIISKNAIDKYNIDVQKRLNIISETFDDCFQAFKLKTILSGCKDNIEEISKHCEKIAENIIAILLKEENDGNIYRLNEYNEKLIKKNILHPMDTFGN